MARGKSSLADKQFETAVESALRRLLERPESELGVEERIKALNVAVRWAAVKARLVLPDHGEGFTEDVE